MQQGVDGPYRPGLRPRSNRAHLPNCTKSGPHLPSRRCTALRVPPGTLRAGVMTSAREGSDLRARRLLAPLGSPELLLSRSLAPREHVPASATRGHDLRAQARYLRARRWSIDCVEL